MKTDLNIRGIHRSQLGSALLLSLMIMGVCTMGVAAWIAIINGRAAYSDATEDGMRRRVALENSRAIAEEYLYNYATTQDSGAAALFPQVTYPPDNAEQPDIVERMQVAAWVDGSLNSTTPVWRASRMGPSNGGGYYRNYQVLLGKGGNQVLRDFEVRSRSPILSGDLVIFNQPTITPGDPSDPDIRFRCNMHVNGRTVFWRPDMIEVRDDNHFSTKAYAVMTRLVGDYPVVDSSGNRLRPSNFPFTPVTGGAVGVGALGYDGRISNVENSYASINSIPSKLDTPIEAVGTVISSERGVESNGSGTITIDLNNPDLDEVLIEGDTSKVVLNGQIDDSAFAAAESMKPVVIVVLQDGYISTRNLSRFELYRRNSRRLIIAVKKERAPWDPSSDLRCTFEWMNTEHNPPEPFPTWRLITIGENTELRYIHDSSNSEVTIYGGLRTDRGLWGSSSLNRKFFIEPEPNPQSLIEGYLDRHVWIESYPSP